MHYERRKEARFCDALSVIIPCYNPDPDRLYACLESLAAVYPAPEIVMVDDGCDEPLTSALRLPEGLGQPRILRHAINRGPLDARRSGLLGATRPYIHFVDADDLVDVALYRALSGRDRLPDILTFRALNQLEDGSETSRGQPEMDHTLLQRAERVESFFGFRYLFSVWNKIYTRELAMQVHANLPTMLDLRFGEDFVFNAYAFWLAESHEHVETVGYRYCQHAAQVSASASQEKMQQRLIADQTTSMTTVLEFLLAQEPGKDRDTAVHAFSVREYHATMRLLQNTLGVTQATQIDEVAHLMDARLAVFAPWAREILRQRERADGLQARIADR
ncbi:MULTISPECIES: glycosyltransferase family 2 protein [Roseovarius]|uniref:glycosyltransferase family 2 protein n=1 Tax=Roseovarius TaxID=74030 RepID=UPI00273FDCE0|nr:MULTISPECIES: glycosyltransferase [unclassified Roseovarius]